MIAASSLFQTVPPLSDGAAESAAGSARAGASAADAFAALLAGLDPADLQTALGVASPSSQGTAAPLGQADVPETVATPLSAFLMPLAGQPVRLPKGNDSTESDRSEETTSADHEQTIDPAAFLMAAAFTPLPDPVARRVSIETSSSESSEGDVDRSVHVIPAALEEMTMPSASAEEMTTASANASAAFAPVAEEPPVATDVDASTFSDINTNGQPADAPKDATSSAPSSPVAQERSRPESSATAAREASPDRRDAIQADAPVSRLPDVRRTSPNTVTQLPVKAAHGTAPAQTTASSESAPTAEAAASNLEGRLMEAVRRIAASALYDAGARPEGQSVQSVQLDASGRPIEAARMDFRMAEDRLVSQALLGTNAENGGSTDASRDQTASQRGFTGTLAVHVPTAASPSTVPVFAMPETSASEQPLPEDAALARQIVQAAQLQLKNGGGDAKLTLHPEYLGEVQISIRVEAGTVTATLHASEPQVRVWMQAHEGLLKQGLADQGLRLDKLDVRNERNERDEDEGSRNRSRQPEQPRPAPQPRGTMPVFELNV